jgi:Zn-dependent peptidase ImmA (M78 family)
VHPGEAEESRKRGVTTFNASYLELEPHELVRQLLREAGQADRSSVNPAELLDFLKLEYLSFDFQREIPEEAKSTVGGGPPRALLSFNDRVVATDESLIDVRSRYCVLHEIGHYVLPHHEHALYVCDDVGMSYATHLLFEKEANAFAAELLFLGDRFTVEANSQMPSALTVKTLATQYDASFEATARRLVEKNFRACMLVVFKKQSGRSQIDTNTPPKWIVRYSVASPAFKNKYFERITNGSVPDDVARLVTRTGRDIADSERRDLFVRTSKEDEGNRFRAEYFSNTYNVFCLLTPD